MSEDPSGKPTEKNGAAVVGRTAETMAAQGNPARPGNPENQVESPEDGKLRPLQEEQKATREELQSTVQVLQTTLQCFYTVLSSMYGGVLLVMEGNRIEFANHAFCSLFDLEDSPEDLRGLTSAETIEKIADAFLHPQEAVARIREIVDSGLAVKGEEVAMRGGRTCLRDCIPICVDGKPYGRVWHHLDITARKKAEETLRRLNADLEQRVAERTPEPAATRTEAVEEKKRLEAVMDGTRNSHLVYLDRDFNFVRVNEAYAGTCGYKPEEMIGKNHFALYPHEENERIFRQVRDTGVPKEFHDKPFVFPDQPERGVTYWDWTLIPVKDDAGEVEGLVFSLVETTERKRTEEALRESQTRFKLLSEIAGRLLASGNPQGLVNELCHRIMVHLDCQIFLNFLLDDRVDRLRLNAWAGIPEEEARRIEWLDYGASVCGCVAKQGRAIAAADIRNTPDIRTDTVRPYGIQAYACHPLIAQGRVIGTLSFGTGTRTSFSPRDLALMKTVTDQVAVAMERDRLIGELQGSRDALEMRVQERTAELLKANRELEQSNRDLEDFAHVASHDLQEPLRKIQTFSDRLATGYGEALDDKARDYLDRMQRAAERMQALVLDLLMYSRIASKPRTAARFKLREAVEEAVTDLLMLREETAGRIEVGELPEIKADRVQMRQLFQNLMGNGLKYHGEEPPFVKVSDRSPSSGAFWEIHVEDNGIGFNESHLDKIFKPFQRLHGRSAPYRGTGMGLAICRRIVERHGGSISARSRPGEGATFIVKLPKGRSQAGKQD